MDNSEIDRAFAATAGNRYALKQNSCVRLRVTTATPSALQRLWLSESVRLREEQAGPLDDDEANRRARAFGGPLNARIEQRAWLLAQRDGQWQALLRWQQGSRLALFILFSLAVLSGFSLAAAALGDGSRAVNVFWALGSLLGVNLLMLLIWMAGLFLAKPDNATLGKLWLWLSGKFARDAQQLQIAPALLLLLQRQQLTRWGLGLLSHSWWSLTMLSALTSLLLMLATRRYGFVWETTILGSESFITLTHALGALPAALGFSMPAESLIRASGDNPLQLETARQAWASWLIGITLIYGLLPRLALTLLCAWRWQRGRKQLSLDLSLPGYNALRERLQPSHERLGVNDAAPAQLHQTHAGSAQNAAGGPALVALELDPKQPWPPVLPASITNAGVIDNREQRRQLLEQLTAQPALRLLIACDPLRSPDRGTLALIGELSRCAEHTRIWLLSDVSGTADPARLNDWQQNLQRLELSYGDQTLLTWLETGHD